MLNRLRLIAALLALSSGLTFLPAEAFAQSEIELQAIRQLEFSKEEVAKGSFERALSSASAAFRLDPTLYDALAYKALAYEGLGELRLAEGLLTTYMDIRGGSDPLAVAEVALERVSQKLGGGSGAVAEEAGGGNGPDGGSGSVATSEGDEPPPESKAEGPGTNEVATDETGPEGEDGSASDPEGVAAEVDGEEGDEPSADEEVVEAPERPGRLERLAELLPSDTSLAALHLMHQRGLLESRAQVGVALMGSGLGLSALGGILMAGSSVAYAQAVLDEQPTDQAAAVYAGAMGMLGAGGALTAVGVPLFVTARVDLKKLDSLERSLAARPAPRLELMAQGLRLRF